MTQPSFSPHGKEVLDLLEERHGGRQMPIISNKMRWKAPWPMTHGNTVACTKHKDGSHTISATGRAAAVTREILGAEDEVKLIGINSTEYAIWQLRAHQKT